MQYFYGFKANPVFFSPYTHFFSVWWELGYRTAWVSHASFFAHSATTDYFPASQSIWYWRFLLYLYKYLEFFPPCFQELDLSDRPFSQIISHILNYSVFRGIRLLDSLGRSCIWEDRRVNLLPFPAATVINFCVWTGKLLIRLNNSSPSAKIKHVAANQVALSLTLLRMTFVLI